MVCCRYSVNGRETAITPPRPWCIMMQRVGMVLTKATGSTLEQVQTSRRTNMISDWKQDPIQSSIRGENPTFLKRMNSGIVLFGYN